VKLQIAPASTDINISVRGEGGVIPPTRQMLQRQTRYLILSSIINLNGRSETTNVKSRKTTANACHVGPICCPTISERRNKQVEKTQENVRTIKIQPTQRIFSFRKRRSLNSNNLRVVQQLQLPLTNKEYLHTRKHINSYGKKLRLVVISNETSVVFVGVCKHKLRNFQCSFPN
jgi:hypothetical protein